MGTFLDTSDPFSCNVNYCRHTAPSGKEIVIDCKPIYKTDIYVLSIDLNFMKNEILYITLVLACLSASTQVIAAPSPFKAIYKADYKGMPVSAVGIRELKLIEDNKYILSSSAKSFFATVAEHSIFRVEEQKIQPIEYQYKRSGIGKNRKVILNFDWQSQTVEDKADAWEMDVSDGVLDKLLYQFKMRQDLQDAVELNQPWPELSYQIADDARLKTYIFKITGEEDIDTPIGKIKTVKTLRIRKNSDRTTTFWLAPDYEFMLIRLKQVEKNGKGFELLLKEAQFNGKQVKGH